MNRFPWLAPLALASALAALHVGGCGSDDLTFQGTPSSSSGAGVASGGSGADGGAGASASSAAQSGAAGPGGAGPGGSSQGGAGQGGAGQGGSGGMPACDAMGGVCAHCLHDACNMAFCACAGEPECLGLLFCLELCGPGDVPCNKECYSEHLEGISAAAILGDCGAASCQGDCPITLDLDACEECLYTSCATQMNACVANPECYDILACVAQCAPNDGTCPSLCVAANPGGLGEASAVQQCVDASCPACQ
jgi:hypothetical protein